MKYVHLAIRDETGTVTGQIHGSFDDAQLQRLSGYLGHVARLNETALVARGIPGISNLRFGKNGFELTAPAYSNAELHELLHVLRPLILEGEQHSFIKTCAIVKKIFRDKSFKEQLRTTRHIYDHGELSLYMQITIGSTRLFDRSILHTWLNGTQYHTDAEKANAWSDLEGALTTDNARALLIAQLRAKVVAVHELAHIANLVVSHDA